MATPWRFSIKNGEQPITSTLAYPPAETFFDAAQCLLLLAEAETESWSNNATGVFNSLFSLGSGELAASELAPTAKVDYLREQLHGDTLSRRALVVQALNKSLAPFVSRMDIDETLGLRRLPSRWMAETFDELCEVYKTHVSLLVEAMDYLPPTESIEAAKGLLDNVRSLILIAPVAPLIISFLQRTATVPELREPCIETLVATLHYEGKALPEDVKATLSIIQNGLTESSFAQKLRRHAGMKLLEDNFNAEGEYRDDAAGELVDITAEALATPSLLEPERSWLVTNEAKNGFQFGQLLGQADERALWSRIAAAWRQAGENRSDFFAGGYLSAVYTKEPECWEQIIEDLLADAAIRHRAIGLIWRSGMSDRVARSLLALAQQGEIDLTTLRVFGYGDVAKQFPLDVLVGLVDLLLDSHDPQAPDAALELLDARTQGDRDALTEMLSRVERVLNSPAFVEGTSTSPQSNTMLFHWNQLANRLIEVDSQAGEQLAVKCIANFSKESSVTGGWRLKWTRQSRHFSG